MTTGGAPQPSLSPWFTPRARRVLRIALGALIVALVGYAVTTVPGARSEPGYSPLIDGWVQNGVLVSATALIALRVVLVRAGRRAWGCVAAGLGLYTLGNILYFGWVQYDETLPYPSAADIPWLASYAFLFVGVLGLARKRIQVSERTLWLDGAVAALGVSAVASVWIDFVLHRTHGSLAALVTTTAYPVADLVLLVVVLGTCGLLGWRPDRTLLLLGGGLVLFAVADTLYVVRVAAGSYQAGTMLDPLWAVAAVLMATAALRRPTHHGRSPSGWSMLVTPTAFTLLALGLLVVGARVELHSVTIGLASCTVLVSLARAAITFRDVQTLSISRVQARTDELTGLPNRRRFREVVQDRLEALPEGERLAVLLLDLDRFKDVNDALGHTAGDQLLISVSRRLQGQLRHVDLLARLGGDVFVIMLANGTPAAGQALAERLRLSLQAAFVIDGTAVHLDASLGIAVYPDVATDVEGLLQRADIAMYQAKSDRLGSVVYQADEADLTDRLRGIEELRHAIDHDELVLYYQPKVDLLTGRLHGVEALLRWQHPQRGLLPPDAFLELAERHGFMRLLTTKVLAAALDQVRTWRSTRGPITVAVNVSASNLLDLELPQQIGAMLAVRGLPGSALTVEITEGGLMVDPDRALEVLHGIARLGVSISIDDYGTGYSSLARLRDLPVTELKLDRSFLQQMDQDPRNASIVDSTIRLAHALGLCVVAEGIETEAVRQKVAAMGCEFGQGYHLGRPVPVADLPASDAWTHLPLPRSAEPDLTAPSAYTE